MNNRLKTYVNVTLFLFGVFLITVAVMMFRYPVSDWYNGNNGRLIVLTFLLGLLWNPVVGVIVAGVGLIACWGVFLPDSKSEAENRKGPRPAEDLRVRSVTRNSITVLLSGFVPLEVKRLQSVLDYLYADEAPSAEVLVMPDEKQWLARVRFGDHAVRLNGVRQVLPNAVQLETIHRSGLSETHKRELMTHRAHVTLEYERGSDAAVEQMLALHTVACAWLELGLLGVTDVQAHTAISRQTVETQWLWYGLLGWRSSLPAQVCAGVCTFVRPDGQTWFFTRGHERFGAPNFALLGERNVALEVFDDLLNFVVFHGGKPKVGGQAKFAGFELRFLEVSEYSEHLIDAGVPTLVLEVLDAPELLEEDDESATIETPVINTGQPVSSSLIGPALAENEQRWLQQQVQVAQRTVQQHTDESVPVAHDMISAMQVIELIVRTVMALRSQVSTTEERRAHVLALGALWGEQAVLGYGFHWARANTKLFVVTDPQTGLEEHPFRLMRHVLLEDGDILLLGGTFNMLSPTLRDAYREMTQGEPRALN
jgi:hypothetical protein